MFWFPLVHWLRERATLLRYAHSKLRYKIYQHPKKKVIFYILCILILICSYIFRRNCQFRGVYIAVVITYSNRKVLRWLCLSNVQFFNFFLDKTSPLSSNRNIQGEHKTFPWLQTFITKKLLYMEYKYIFFKCNPRSFFYNTSVHFDMCSFCWHAERLIDNQFLSTCSPTCLQLL